MIETAKRQVLLINCSPRRNGNTSKILSAVKKSAQENGLAVNEFFVEGKNIHPCRDCKVCLNDKPCAIKDDMDELYDLLKVSDAVIIGTPVYWFGMTAQAKTILDRLHACKEEDIKAKIGGIVVTADSSGIIDTIKHLVFAYATMGIIVADCIGCYAPILDGGKALATAEAMSAKIASILNKYGDDLPDVRVQHIAFGTHTK